MKGLAMMAATRRQPYGEWVEVSRTRHVIVLECGIQLTLYRGANSVWRYTTIGIGKLGDSVFSTNTEDLSEAKRLALRWLTLQLSIANDQVSAALINIGTGFS